MQPCWTTAKPYTVLSRSASTVTPRSLLAARENSHCPCMAFPNTAGHGGWRLRRGKSRATRALRLPHGEPRSETFRLSPGRNHFFLQDADIEWGSILYTVTRDVVCFAVAAQPPVAG